MIKLRTAIIIFVLYLIAYLSIRFDINVLYPYYYLKDFVLYPVNALTNTKDITISKDLYESKIKALQDDLDDLKKLTKINLVLSDYSMVNATVVERNREYWFNTITINKGSSDGVKQDDAVIDGNGLIGKIVQVRKYFSDVKLITTNDEKSKISVVIHNKDKDYYGIMHGYDSKKNLLKIILFDEADIYDDMKVETTGMGGIFPSGILIGHVFDCYKDSDDVTFIVRVRPSGNLEGEKYVSIVQRKEVSNS